MFGLGPRLAGIRTRPIRASISLSHSFDPAGCPTLSGPAQRGIGYRFVEGLAQQRREVADTLDRTVTSDNRSK
jgi:hypothetical protein